MNKQKSRKISSLNLNRIIKSNGPQISLSQRQNNLIQSGIIIVQQVPLPDRLQILRGIIWPLYSQVRVILVVLFFLKPLNDELGQDHLVYDVLSDESDCGQL